jgi:hypothetical protein
MSDNDSKGISEAAASVMAALQPLAPEERGRVIQSMAALFGVTPMTSAQQARGPAGPPVNTDQKQRGAGGGKPVSLVELIKEKQPVSNAQRIACFAYYREKFEGVQNFSSADLEGYFAKAKLPAPGKNYMREYNKAVKEAWIHDDGAKSYLTQEGERAVDEGFGGKGKPRGATSGKKKRKASKE